MKKIVKINFLTKNNIKPHHITFRFLKLFGIYKLFIIWQNIQTSSTSFTKVVFIFISSTSRKRKKQNYLMNISR